MDQVPPTLSISEARGRLPELARYLCSHPDRCILIAHRDLEETLAVTTLSHLRYLETLVERLAQSREKPFRLAGSISSPHLDEELERRLEQARRQEEREARQRADEFSS